MCVSRYFRILSKYKLYICWCTHGLDGFVIIRNNLVLCSLSFLLKGENMILIIARVFILLGFLFAITGYIGYCVFAYTLATALISYLFVKNRVTGNNSNKKDRL